MIRNFRQKYSQQKLLFKKYLKVRRFPKKEWTKSLTTPQISFVDSVVKSLYYVSNIVEYAFY